MAIVLPRSAFRMGCVSEIIENTGIVSLVSPWTVGNYPAHSLYREEMNDEMRPYLQLLTKPIQWKATS